MNWESDHAAMALDGRHCRGTVAQVQHCSLSSDDETQQDATGDEARSEVAAINFQGLLTAATAATEAAAAAPVAAAALL